MKAAHAPAAPPECTHGLGEYAYAVSWALQDDGACVCEDCGERCEHPEWKRRGCVHCGVDYVSIHAEEGV